MSVKFAATFLLAVLSFGLQAQQTKTVKALSNALSMALPIDFKELSDGEISKIYPASGPQRPNVVYMSEAKDFLVSLNLTAQKMTDQGLVAHKDEFFKMMRRNPSAFWIGGEEKAINGKRYLICTFTKTSRAGESNYNKMFFTSLRGTLLMGTISIENGTPTDAQKAELDAILTSLKM